MTYCFQYFNVYPDGTGKSTFCSSRKMDGSVWSFHTIGGKLQCISLPIVAWKVKSINIPGWKIKFSHQIIDHKIKNNAVNKL